MLGFPVSDWLDTVEDALNKVSTPMWESSQMAYQQARERYPNLSFLGTVVLCAVVGFGVCKSRSRKTKQKQANKQSEQDQIHQTLREQLHGIQNQQNQMSNAIDGLTGIAAKQMEFYKQEIVMLIDVRRRLDQQPSTQAQEQEELLRLAKLGKNRKAGNQDFKPLKRHR